MISRNDQDFHRFRDRGDSRALGRVFDRLAPELLLVAAHLAGGDVAEDLVQATFLDAIRRQDRWDGKRPLAGWLAGILANHVRQARRERHRVPDPLRLPGLAPPTPRSEAEASEVAELVHRAVRQLPSRYRQVLSLRLLHELEIQQIAHSLGMPLGTVKTRLHRGTAMLKKALPPGLAGSLAGGLLPSRGLAAVREVVMGHAASTGAAAGTTGIGLALGVMTMKKTLGWMAAAVLVGGGWLTRDLWLETETAPPGSGIEARGKAVTASVPSAGPRELAADAEPLEDRGALPRQPVPTTGTIDLSVVWKEDGVPAGGRVVRLYHDEGRRKWDGPHNHETDEAGRLLLTDLRPGSYLLSTSGGTGRRVELQAGKTTSLVLSIEGGLVLCAEVVDRDGRPVPRAEVWALGDEGSNGSTSRMGQTGSDGRVVIRSMPVSVLWARHDGTQPSRPVALGSDKKGRHDVRLVLREAGCTVTGTVLDPEGRTVAGALVVIGLYESAMGLAREDRPVALPAETDELGRFVCNEVPAGDHPVMAATPGFAAARARVLAKAGEPVDVTLSLQVGATVLGRITDRTGNGLAGAEVRAVAVRSPQGFEGYRNRLAARRAETDSDGDYRLSGVESSTVALVAQADMLPEAHRRVELRNAEVLRWDLRLPAGEALAGQVVNEKGGALPGWVVAISGVGGEGMAHMLTEKLVFTDREGRFRCEGLPDTTFRISVFDPEATGAARSVCLAGLEEVRPPATDLVLRIAAGESRSFIEGSVQWADGEERKPVELSLYPSNRGHGGFTVPQERLPPGTDSFRIGPLPAGDYDLFCDVEGHDRLAHRGLRVAAGQTLNLTSFRLDEQRPLRIRLRHRDGGPVTGAKVSIGEGIPCEENEPGTYDSLRALPGRYSVVAHGHDFAAFRQNLQLHDGQASIVTVSDGTNVELRVRPPGPPREQWVAALRLEVRDSLGGELLHETLSVGDPKEFRWQVGLLPGRYLLEASDSFGPRALQKSLTFEVPAISGHPYVVEVQLEEQR